MGSTSRQWDFARQAYVPRFWPTWMASMAVIVPLAVLLEARMLAAMAMGASAIVPVHVRFWIWRRRHPVLSRAELEEVARRAARWN